MVVGLRHYPPRAERSAAGHWSPGRDRATQHRFREAVLRLAGQRCQYVYLEGGYEYRCTETSGLQAHHRDPGNNDPNTGLALCRPHHKALDPHAR